MKKHLRTGFTLIEVTLFVALTGLLLIGILGSTWSSISRQRANDTVQNFADFLRGQYSAVSNVQNSSTGNSNQAIYGRVTTFGEPNTPANNPTKSNGVIYGYDLIGDLKPSDAIIRLSVVSMLDAVNAQAIISEPIAGTSSFSYGVHGQSEYVIRNGAELKKICYRSRVEENCKNERELSKLTMLVVRSPNSGTIHTFFIPNSVPSIQRLLALQSRRVVISDAEHESSLIKKNDLAEDNIVDFCIQPQDIASDRLYDIRLKLGINNSTGVEIIDLDSSDNICERNN